MQNLFIEVAKRRVKLLRLKGDKSTSSKITRLIEQYEDSKITLDTFKQYYFNYLNGPILG